MLAQKARSLIKRRNKTVSEIFPTNIGDLEVSPEAPLTEHQSIIRSLVKILDEAILPAVVLIGAKVIGLVIANLIGGFTYTIESGYSALPWTVVYASTSEAVTANDISNFIMYLVVFLGFCWVLLKAHFLHDTHLPPKFAGRLAKLHLFHFVQTTFEIYHQALVWLSFLWLTTLVIFIYTFSGASVALALIALALSSASTFLYTKDIEVEIRTDKVLRENT